MEEATRLNWRSSQTPRIGTGRYVLHRNYSSTDDGPATAVDMLSHITVYDSSIP
jgi:hypothetical protein